MAKNVDLTSKEWCDLVFDGRNKEFGAYALRMDSKPRHLKSFIYTLVGALIIGIVAYSYMKVAAYIEEQRILNEASQQEVLFECSGNRYIGLRRGS